MRGLILTQPPRIGMHLLFYGALQKKMLQMDWLQNLLKEQSIKVSSFSHRTSSPRQITPVSHPPLHDILIPNLPTFILPARPNLRLPRLHACYPGLHQHVQDRHGGAAGTGPEQVWVL